MAENMATEFAKRIRECWKLAEDILASTAGFHYVSPDGGFYVTLQLEDLDEEQAAGAILKENHLLVHPGLFLRHGSEPSDPEFCADSQK